MFSICFSYLLTGASISAPIRRKYTFYLQMTKPELRIIKEATTPTTIAVTSLISFAATEGKCI